MFQARFHNFARETLRHCFGDRTSFSDKGGNVRTGAQTAAFFPRAYGPRLLPLRRDVLGVSFAIHCLLPIYPYCSRESRGSALQGSMEADVLEVDGLSVDAALGRGNPASHFAALEDAVHQAVHKGAVV